jgi:hypothetical protein
MPFVKLDTRILNSTLWFERDARELFITALLMAEPRETQEPLPQLKVDAIKYTGFTVPPGWYGFVAAAGIGIIRQSGMDRKPGMKALADLGNPDIESRSKDFDGRRLVRVDGGFIVLNYMKHRERDATVAERMRRYRARQKELQGNDVTLPRNVTPTGQKVAPAIRNITQAEAEAEAEADKSRARTKRFAPPSLAELKKFIHDRKSPIDPQRFLDFYTSKGWRIGSQPMKDWKAAVRTWERREGWAPTDPAKVAAGQVLCDACGCRGGHESWCSVAHPEEHARIKKLRDKMGRKLG